MTNWLALIAFALPTYLVRGVVLGVPTTLLELLILTMTVMAIGVLIRDRSARVRLLARRSWLLPALLLFVGALVGLAIADDQRRALGLFKGFILDPLFVYVTALAFVQNAHDRDRIIKALWTSTVVVALTAVAQAVITGEPRALGVYALDPDASPNYLAFALAPSIPLTVYLMRQKLFPRLVSVAGLLILIAGLILTVSRAGIVVGLLGLAVAGIVGSSPFLRSVRQQRWTVIGLLLLGVGSWWAVRPDFTRSPADGGRVTSSTNIRWQLWSATGELVASQPLTGLGLGEFQTAFTKLTAGRVNYPEFIAPQARTPHNLLVGFWVETGLFGFAACVSVVLLVLRKLLAALRQRTEPAFVAALLGVWLVIIVHGLVDMPVWKNDGMVWYWLFVALVASLPLTSTKESA